MIECTEDTIDVNSLRGYRMWMYFGNYSSPYDGIIQRGSIGDGEASSFLKKSPKLQRAMDGARHESSEQINLRMACRHYYFVGPARNECADIERRENYHGTLLHWAALTGMTLPSFPSFLHSFFHSSVLCTCSPAGNLEMVRMLCEHGADIHRRVPAFGCTAKDIAAANGFDAVYCYLAGLEVQKDFVGK